MRNLIATLMVVASVLTTCAQNADVTITVPSTQNVQVTFNPDGQLDTLIGWTINGPGSMQTVSARTFVFVTNGAGVSTLTFTAGSQGTTVTNRVVVTVVAPPPPATTLGPSVTAVAK